MTLNPAPHTGFLTGPAPEAAALSAGLYEPYAAQSIAIEDAKPHPTTLVQSAAMASVAPPKPTHRPHLPKSVVESGLLSDAQFESVVYAGEANGGLLAGSFLVNESFDTVSAAADDAENAARLRRGYWHSLTRSATSPSYPPSSRKRSAK